jgi:isopenicillin N synthase-like dioxygenase
MGSEAKSSRILVVNFCDENLKPGTSKWTETCKQIRLALEDCGGFVANFDNTLLSPELHNNFFSAAKQLFELPIETKTQNTSDKPLHNHFIKFESLPLYESLAIDDPANLEANRWFTERMWPAGNEFFSKNAHAMAKTLVELNHLAMRMIFDAYGIDQERCESFIQSGTHLLRMYKYRVPKEGETHVGTRAHSDRNTLTIIHQGHNVNGLSMRTPEGDWIELDLSPSSFFIMGADVLMAWSNGKVIPCMHQVTMNASETRYSIGLHSFNDGIIEVPKEFVDEEHPLRYKPFDCFEYLRFYEADSSKSISHYCGIEN